MRSFFLSVVLVVPSIALASTEQLWLSKVTAYSTLALVVVTGILACFTLTLWLATGALVRGARDTAQRQLRAYMAQASVHAMPADRKIVFKVRNEGETPAHDVVIRVLVSKDEPIEGKWDHAFDYESAPQLLQRAQGYDADVRFTDPLVAVAVQKNLPYYVYAEIDYRDSFTRLWRTVFAAQWRPNKGVWEPYKDYNKEIDRSPPRKGWKLTGTA